jgi:hypothetical protein
MAGKAWSQEITLVCFICILQHGELVLQEYNAIKSETKEPNNEQLVTCDIFRGIVAAARNDVNLWLGRKTIMSVNSGTLANVWKELEGKILSLEPSHCPNHSESPPGSTQQATRQR